MSSLSMLAARGEILPVVVVMFGFVLMVVFRSAREKEERRRLEVIEKALHSGVLDEATKRQLVEAVAPRRREWHRSGLAGIAWLGLFAGIGMLLLAVLEDESWLAPGVITGLASFGVLSLPVAMRELRAREQPQ